MKWTQLSALCFSTALLTACGGGSPQDPASGGGGTGGNGGDGDGNGGEIGGAGGGGGDGGQPPYVCPEPTGGPTLHGGKVTGHEVWSADASPHIIETRLDVNGGATLEIEPCAIVEVAQGVSVNVAFPGTPTTGTLLAEGTESEPIIWRGHDGARWGRIYVHAPGEVRLAHVILSDGGGADPIGATLFGEGTGTSPTHRGLFVDHVRIESSLGAGIALDRRFAFTIDSRDLRIEASGNAQSPYPLRVDEHAMGSVPSGDYTGNARDAILIDPRANLAEDATLRQRGVDYYVGNSPNDHLTVASGNVGAVPTKLTIEPGVTLKFHEQTALRIEAATGAFPATGALIAHGSLVAPIVFASAEPSPQAGDWVGLWFGGIVSEHTQLSNVRIEHTGADCGCVLVSCNEVAGYEGAIIMSQEPPAPFIQDSVIANGSGHGIVLGYFGGPVELAESNAFHNIAGCDVTLPSLPQCPQPKPACE